VSFQTKSGAEWVARKMLCAVRASDSKVGRLAEQATEEEEQEVEEVEAAAAEEVEVEGEVESSSASVEVFAAADVVASLEVGEEEAAAVGREEDVCRPDVVDGSSSSSAGEVCIDAEEERCDEAVGCEVEEWERFDEEGEEEEEESVSIACKREDQLDSPTSTAIRTLFCSLYQYTAAPIPAARKRAKKRKSATLFACVGKRQR
jgi:hypothetical protein